MLEQDTIKELLARSDITPRDKILICLAHDPLRPHKVSEVKNFAIGIGLRAAKGWNISRYLSNAKTLAIRTSDGWELTATGKSFVADITGPLLPSVTALVVSGLRKQLPTIASEFTRAFVEESVKALEAKLYRSAIVLSWVGALSVLYDHIVTNHLTEFNAEAIRRDPKWKAARTPDDLTRLKEHDFLQILPAISVIGKNVKDELELCLKLRNGCGHPNSLIVGEHKASAHVETLIQNVFAKFRTAN
ncbi:hypothetical protein KDX08_17160 [Burkholderia cenocepacia]|uniref:DUF4145 domain-containing protein n=1 Tax=Burkholderia cenocepacia TaxID=95486 RepID=A0AAW4T3T9_9BURK|nr:hypothetical protein [Burkholderia cenocepacia]MBR7994179.1 hypothetical protein [Burkholderia cenocepacia]MCA8377877.1 hypothetical protein [Burkholderia cenocepacia]HDR9803260.1 hypothetical protein [Burkholderia cenocepacia]HDR9810586.1 hypothetical protein [Burkholderia cenocepacia]HDR9816722.1 hypothetical protein [Burkholderia cenocepacia]